MTANLIAGLAVLVAIAAVLGPALVYLGVRLGLLTNIANSAHKRIDRNEEQMREEFADLKSTLAEAIREGWRHCPLATQAGHHRDGD